MLTGKPISSDNATTTCDLVGDPQVRARPDTASDADQSPELQSDEPRPAGGRATPVPASDPDYWAPDYDAWRHDGLPDEPVSVGLPKLVSAGPPLVARLKATTTPSCVATTSGSDPASDSPARESATKNAGAEPPTSEVSPDLAELRWPSRLASLQRPVLLAGNLDLPAITRLVWERVHTVNDPRFLYRFAGRIHWIEPGDAGQPKLRRVRRDELRYVAARVGNWKVKQGKKLVPAVPPTPVMDDMLAAPESHLPVLERILATPVFASDGRLIATPGYDAASGILYAPPRDFVLPPLPPNPTGAEVQAALAVIEDIIQDFGFVDQSDHAHILSLFFLPLVRELIPGPTPLHLIKKPAPGTGASLLVDVLMTTVLGRQLSAMTEGGEEAEWRKRLTAKLREGPAGVLIDNLKARLDSAALSAVLTAIVYEDRLLQKSEILQLPVRCVFVATGNNPSLSNEMARRTIPIYLDAKVAKPWLRQGTTFQHADLRGYVGPRRADIVAAGLTICLAWIQAGRPPGSETIGMFEDWSRVMGGVLAFAGVPGFLGNLSTFYEDADTETEAWEALFGRWRQAYGDRAVGAADLYKLVVGAGGQDPIPLDLGRSAEHGQKTVLGTKLKQMNGRIFGGYRLEKAGTRHKAGQWRLVPAGEPR